MTAFSDETGRDWLPLKYEDGPDFCTVTFATGAAFALTVHPERMKLMEAALSASPVAQKSQLLTLLDDATVILQGLIEHPDDKDSWDDANKLLPKLLSRLERQGDECCAHGVELHQDCYRCDEGPVAQEPVARLCGYCKTWNSKPCGEQCYLQPSDPVWTSPPATQQASADFLHEEMIKLGSPLTYTACLTLTKRITDTNTLAWAGEVNKLCTEIGSLKNEIAALKSAASPPATSAGVGADEIARHGIYIASKTKHADRWRFLRDKVGEPIISTWIDEAGEGESSDLHDLWRRCLTEASSCQVLIAYREKDEVLKGGWVEIGAALSSGIPVYAVGLEEFTIAKYRGITHFPDMKSAIAASRTILALLSRAGDQGNSTQKDGSR